VSAGVRVFNTIFYVVMLVTASGLIARRRWRLSGFFAAYLGFCLITNPMWVWWPERFFHQWFYLFMQTGYDVLKFGIAIEVAWRTFRPFPGARFSALVIGLLVLGATALAAATVPIGPDAWEWETVYLEFFPRIKAGTLWLMAVTLLLAHWYHVPIHAFRAGLLTSFVCYLGFVCGLHWLSGDGSGAFVPYIKVLGAISGGLDLVLAGYWGYLAWRPDTAMVLAHGQTLRRLETASSLAGSPP
jgi:hypothetical protein